MTSISAAPTQLERHRQQFPALANKIFQLAAADAPNGNGCHNHCPRIHSAVPFSTEVNAWIAQEVEQTRLAIATGVGSPAETMTLTEDVTVGCNVLWVLTGKP